MSEQTLLKPAPQRNPTAAPDAPPIVEPAVFAPSAELGRQLEHLEHEQTEIDRRAAEELARLRALQDRD